MTGDERRDGAGADGRATRRSLLRVGGAALAAAVGGCVALSGRDGEQDRRSAQDDGEPTTAARNAPNASNASDAPNASNASREGNASSAPDAATQRFPFTDPLLHVGFESERYASKFTDVDEWNAENRRVVRRSANDGSGLAVTMDRGAHWGTILRYEFREAGYEEPEELYARYHVCFPEDFQAVRGGGKLPGFSGEYDGLAFGGHPTDGTDGWSARGGFEPAYRGADPTEVPLSLYYYVYHADMNGQFGDRFYWDERVGRGEWHRIDQYVRMNAPGQRDGVLRAWIDGDLACDVTTLRFRDAGYGNIKIKGYLLTTYYGGYWSSPSNNTVFFDDLTLSWPADGTATATNGTGNGTAANETGTGRAANGTGNGSATSGTGNGSVTDGAGDETAANGTGNRSASNGTRR